MRANSHIESAVSKIGLGEKALDCHGLQLLSDRQDLVDEATLLVNKSAEVGHVALVAGAPRFFYLALTEPCHLSRVDATGIETVTSAV